MPAPEDRTPSADTITWRQLLAETTTAVGDAQHARWLCESASGTTPDEFRAALDSPATVRTVAALDSMVRRLRTGEPLQYVIGSWGFRSLDLAVDRRALIPRPETELVAGLAIERAAARPDSRVVVDLGTGTGAIGLSAAVELPLDGTTVWLTDADADALDLARANLAGIGRAAVNVRIAAGSWFDALPPELRADVIVSNPPYVATDSADLEAVVADWEPPTALFAGVDGLDDLRSIVAGAPDHLSDDGWLVVEHGHDQADALRALFDDAGFVEVETHADLAGHPRATSGRISRTGPRPRRESTPLRR